MPQPGVGKAHALIEKRRANAGKAQSKRSGALCGFALRPATLAFLPKRGKRQDVEKQAVSATIAPVWHCPGWPEISPQQSH